MSLVNVPTIKKWVVFKLPKHPSAPLEKKYPSLSLGREYILSLKPKYILVIYKLFISQYIFNLFQALAGKQFGLPSSWYIDSLLFNTTLHDGMLSR
jgi:hypothetical protein